MRVTVQQKQPLIYCQCMEEVRKRLDVAKDLVAEIRAGGEEHVQMTELIFVQMRKVLELIAFGSLTANKDAYATIRADFENEWNAKRLLTKLAVVNPKFYPEPLKTPVLKPDGTKFGDRVTTGFMTKSQFVVLYNVSSEVLHARNPFKKKNPVTHLGFSIDQWIERIQTLLRMHLIQLLDGGVWVIEIRSGGAVHVFPGSPTPDGPIKK
jgi:hypothetical protein